MCKQPDNEIRAVNKSLYNVRNWCSVNKLRLNTDKTNYIVIKNQQNDYQAEITKRIFIGDSIISKADNI